MENCCTRADKSDNLFVEFGHRFITCLCVSHSATSRGFLDLVNIRSPIRLLICLSETFAVTSSASSLGRRHEPWKMRMLYC